MARTSLKALEIPEGVTLEDNQGVITFTGKLGNMSLEIHKDVDINKDDSTISFSPNKDTKESLAITGTMRALTANYMQGVASGFEKKLEINGVGYRAALEGNSLNLSLGFSHPIIHELPEGVTPTITDRDFTIATLQSPGGGVKNEEDEEVESTESSEETETE